MTIERKIKSGVTSGLTLAALATGATYAETLTYNLIGKEYSNTTPYIQGIEVKTFTSSQTIGSSVNMFTDMHTISLEKHDTPESIIEKALNQINDYHFIEVDDKIDQEIDAYFSNRKSKKTKKILYTRQ